MPVHYHILVIPLHRWRFSFFLMISSYHNREHKPLVIRVVHQNREDEKNSSEFFEVNSEGIIRI